MTKPNVGDLIPIGDVTNEEFEEHKREFNAHKAENTQQAHFAKNIGLEDTEGNFTATELEGAMSELFTNVSNGKSLVGGAITGVDDSVVIPADPTFSDLANAISEISTGPDIGNALAVVRESHLYNKDGIKSIVKVIDDGFFLYALADTTSSYYRRVYKLNRETLEIVASSGNMAFNDNVRISAGMAHDNNSLYISGSDRFRVLNKSDLSVVASSSALTLMRHVEVDDNYIYMVKHVNNTSVFNLYVANKTDLNVVKETPLQYGYTEGFSVDEDFIYTAHRIRNTLYKYSKTSLDLVASSVRLPSDVHGIDIDTNFIYVLQARTISIMDKTDMSIVKTSMDFDSTGQPLVSIYYSDGRLYIGFQGGVGNHRVVVLDSATLEEITKTISFDQVPYFISGYKDLIYSVPDFTGYAAEALEFKQLALLGGD